MTGQGPPSLDDPSLNETAPLSLQAGGGEVDDAHSQAESAASNHSTVSTVLSLTAIPSAGRRVGVLGGSFIMLNTVVGGGISLVATPYAARCLGLGTFIGVEAVFGVMSVMSLHLIGQVLSAVHNFNLFEVAEMRIGRWAGIVLAMAITISNVFVVTAFCQIAFDACDAIFPDAPSSTPALVVGALVAVVTPMSCSQHVSTIEPLALPCTLLWSTFVLLLFINFGVSVGKDNLESSWEGTTSTTDILFGKGIPAINLSWTCQFNAPPLFASLAPQTRKSMTQVGRNMSGSAALLYMMLGVSTYLYFGAGLRDDIMQSIDPNSGGKGLEWGRPAVIVVELCLGLSVIASQPFFLIEARNMAHGLFVRHDPHAREDQRTTPRLLRCGETVAMATFAYVLALTTRGNLSLVLAIVGMLPATIIAWLMPGLLAFVAGRDKNLDLPSYCSACGALLMVFGALMVPLGIVSLTGLYGNDSG